MKKLLLIAFSLNFVACWNQEQTASPDEPLHQIDATAKKVNQVIPTLKIDTTKLAEEERGFIEIADSISSDIDLNKSKYVRSKTSHVVQDGVETDIEYLAYSQYDNGTIAKIVVVSVNPNKELRYTYYYSKRKAIKCITEIGDEPPFACSVYYYHDKTIHPREISDQSSEASKALSILALNHFK